MSIPRVAVVSILLGVCLAAEVASAQSLGTIRWQLQPCCNVVTVTVVQQGAQYQIDGTDDQCGTDQRAGVTGLAFVNPNGSVGLGLSVVTAPGGVPVHIDATIALSTLGGTWRDSAGATGAFVFTPGPGIPGSPRPPAGIGVSAIDTAQVQARVSGVCPAGQLMTSVNQDGTVACTTVAAAGGGDITAVMAGAGLTGGGLSGDVALAVNFAGTGAAQAAARSDHTHAGPETNSTRIGTLALEGVTTGTHNTAVGSGSLELTTTGSLNTAVGAGALYANVGGVNNVAVGSSALNASTSSYNTAVGVDSMMNTVSGQGNSALGWSTLRSSTGGDNNTAVGTQARFSSISGSSNVAIGMNALFYSLGSDNIALGLTRAPTRSTATTTSTSVLHRPSPTRATRPTSGTSPAPRPPAAPPSSSTPPASWARPPRRPGSRRTLWRSAMSATSSRRCGRRRSTTSRSSTTARG